MKKFKDKFMTSKEFNQAFCDEVCFTFVERRPKILVIDKDHKCTHVVQIIKED